MDILRQFNETIQQWIAWLDEYDVETLCWKPRPGSWSIGQVYIHLLVSTEFFIQQPKIAAATSAFRDEPMHEDARRMLAENAFPDKIMEGPDNDGNIPQPTGKDEIATRLERIRQDLNAWLPGLDETSAAGKTRHPGLQFLAAPEWIRFAEMHMRHHFRQKTRIDRQYAARKLTQG